MITTASPAETRLGYEPDSAGLAPGRPRIASLDIVRGIVMVLMAIDHVRVYSGVPAGGPTAGVFFTRWVTHFCAPAFVFLAGTGAFLHGQKLGDRRALARYLLTRGLMLVVLELTLIKASWTFNADYSQFILAGVIWMLGWCMVLMAPLVFLPTRVIGVLGLIVILGQDLFGPVLGALQSAVPALGWLCQFLYLGGEVQLGASGPSITVLYVIVPWIGVMMAGYAFGAIMIREPAERRTLCLRIGLSATGAFVLIAGLAVVLGRGSGGDAGGDGGPPAWMAFFNQRKYPASQLFLLMTIGPAIALLPWAERARGWFVGMLDTFGRVPMFYYLLHIPLIHATALVVNLIRDGAALGERYATAPYVQMPPEMRWGLPLLYLVFAIVVALLYPACRWFARVKARRQDVWLRYI